MENQKKNHALEALNERYKNPSDVYKITLKPDEALDILGNLRKITMPKIAVSGKWILLTVIFCHCFNGHAA